MVFLARQWEMGLTTPAGWPIIAKFSKKTLNSGIDNRACHIWTGLLPFKPAFIDLYILYLGRCYWPLQELLSVLPTFKTHEKGHFVPHFKPTTNSLFPLPFYCTPTFLIPLKKSITYKLTMLASIG